jgi:hypothetical protein
MISSTPATSPPIRRSTAASGPPTRPTSICCPRTPTRPLSAARPRFGTEAHPKQDRDFCFRVKAKAALAHIPVPPEGEGEGRDGRGVGENTVEWLGVEKSDFFRRASHEQATYACRCRSMPRLEQARSLFVGATAWLRTIIAANGPPRPSPSLPEKHGGCAARHRFRRPDRRWPT